MLLAADVLSFAVGRKGWSRFISSFLLFFSQIVITEFALGVIAALNIISLSIVNTLITGGILGSVYRLYGKKLIFSYFNDTLVTLRQAYKLALHDKLWTLLLGVTISAVSWIIFLGIIFPATDFDGNSYHLTFMGNVMQSGSINDAPTSLPWLNGYPKGGELIGIWSMILAHSDVFVDLAQIPFLILGVISLYRISRVLGADAKHARFASLLFVFLPIVLNQLKTTYVDVMLCALFFAAIAMVIQKKLSKFDLILTGAIFSLIISIKATGFLFVAALLPLLVWNLIQNQDKKKGFYHNYLNALLVAAAPTIFGLYWYVKNIILYSTPIYPFGFKLAGMSIFPGRTFQEFAADAVNQSTVLPSGTIERIWFVWTEQKDWFGCFYNYDSNYTGLGPIWFVLLIPSTIVALYFAVKERQTKFLAFFITIVALFTIYPSNYYTRYTMFITVVGVVSLALVLSRINHLTSLLIKWLAVLIALFVFTTNISLCNYPPGMVREQIKSLQNGSVRGAIYDGGPWKPFSLLEARLKKNDVVAYDSSPYFIYPLWKPDYSDKVIYLPVSNRFEWRKKLTDNKVRYIMTTVGSRENLWAKEMNTIKSLYKDETYEVFEVL